MLERSPRRLAVLSAAMAALLTAAGSASASRGGGSGRDDALAAAAAVQLNNITMVSAEARGDQSAAASGPDVTVSGIAGIRSAEVDVQTRVQTELSARAEVRLADVTLSAPAGRVAELTGEARRKAAAHLRTALSAVCTTGISVEANVVAGAAVSGAVQALATLPSGAVSLEASLQADLRKAVHLVVDSEDLGAPLCGGPLEQLAARIDSATESVLRRAIDSDLSFSFLALRTECDLGRRHGTARTQLLVDEHTASRLGIGGQLDDGRVLVDVPPNTGVDLGAGVHLALNEQQTTHRPGSHAGITAKGVVIRIDGVVAAAVASTRCELRSKTRIDAGDRPEIGFRSEVTVDVGWAAGRY